jgi:malonate-semialdehyde dehydrogenase (acetylating) / methylmalonate-semialdehyde dehydrogenase
LKKKAQQIRVEPGYVEGVGMGPLITEQQRDRVATYISEGVSQGASLVLDGREKNAVASAGLDEGFFLNPTIFDHVRPDMTIYRDEIFGPVVVVLRAASLDDAIALVNGSPYGNSAAIFTRSGTAARRFQNEIEVGMVGINVPLPVPMFFSFGGWKASLFGDLNMHGIEGVYFYTRRKVITSRWTESDVASPPSLGMPTM